MYPTSAHYDALPMDPEANDTDPHLYVLGLPQKQRTAVRSFERTLFFRICALFLLLIITVFIISRTVASPLGPDFVFDATPKPLYIDTPIDRPLVIRLAIISRVDGFERRQAIRQAVLDGIPASDVKLQYKFFVGRVRNRENGSTLEPQDVGTVRKISRENEVNGNDVVVLDDIEDVPERISEKRFAALRWANDVAPNEYDYAMTMDSDTFCRFRTLARRIRHMYSQLKPREDPVLIGSMSKHHVYWQNTVHDGTSNTELNKEDLWVEGPVYPYPVGIGYMLSSNLTATILSADPAVPHHIHYPYDDVMIGSWVAAFKELHNPGAFASHNTLPSLFDQVSPGLSLTPYLPYAVNTTIVDDKVGWHDFKRRGSVRTEHAIGWDTACVHRMAPGEMIAFRGMEEVRKEWDF